MRLRRNVGVVVKNREGKVLAGLRTHASGDKAWQLPQGGIEGREKPATAAYRELREETGLDPRAVKLLREHEGWIDYLLPPTMAAGRKFNGQTQKWYLFEYLEQGLPDITKATDKEFEQLAWVEMDWLIAHVIEFRKPVYKRVKSLFRL
ncbi:MAG: RNA pyrophosphohydrolase [Pseudomonadota bacterium]